MKQTVFSNRRGTTLIETLVSVGLLSLVLLGTLGLLKNMFNMWAKGSSGTTANQYACQALNQMVKEIEEGRSATIVGGKLVVAFPFYNTATGDYDRSANGQTVTYYLSGNTGYETTGTNLTNLWKSVANGPKTRLAKHIDELEFGMDNPRAVQIRLRGTDREGGAVEPKTVRITIRLRNG